MRSSKRLTALAISALTAGALPLVLLGTGGSAHAAPDPSHISFTLEGCRGDAGQFPALGPFVCSEALYTTGNLGKGWNELDLVPHRLTTSAGSQDAATTTYTIAIVADSSRGGALGYDFISVPVPRTPATCSISAGALTELDPGFGGADSSLYRLVTITQPKGSTCVWDYYQRLAIGSSAFTGSSLQSNLANQNLGSQGIGQKRVSIPDTPAPQTISKTMSATQGSDHAWNVTKSPSPSVLSFGDTCAPGAGLSRNVTITISWERLPAVPGGPVTVVTNIYANNPAHRPIQVDVSDAIYAGLTPVGAVLDAATSGLVTVPAQTNDFLVLSHTATLASGPASFNDLATASYTDPVAGLPPIGVTRTAAATAPVQLSGPEANQTATITDTESITGTGLTFSVAAPSVGSFTGGYVAGTATTGPVGWTSGTQSGSGSVSFVKTVYLDQARITTGVLSDTATLTGSGGSGFAPASAGASASVDISSTATVALTITKFLRLVLDADDPVQAFTFHVSGPGGYASTHQISFGPGDGGATPKTLTISGLAPGSYTVTEDPLAPWAPQLPAVATIDLPTCAGGVQFVNGFDAASAQVSKVTVPAGNEAGWQFMLTGPGIPAPGETVATTGTGFVAFATLLAEEGAYTITETGQAGFDQTGSSSECSFTVDFPADAGRLFSCTFTNTERSSVTVLKTQNGGVPTLGYTFRLTGGPDAVTLLRTTGAGNGGTLDFGSLKPGTYTLCELAVPAGTHSTLADLAGAVVDATTGDVCLTFTLAPGADRAFTIDNSRPEGDQRTIGYWKNWNSCSATGRDRVAMAAKTGNHLLDEFLPQTLGNYVVDTCAKAVAVLNAASGKWAENQLAAQLLAAKLNLTAGAGVCSAATDAVNSANALLVTIGYTGPPSTKIGNHSPHRANALTLAGTLDQYNNGLLC